MTRAGRGIALRPWLPALAWMAVIFVVSSQTGLRVSDDAGVDRPIRAGAHVGTYAILAGLLVYGLTGSRRSSVGVASAAAVGAVLYGVTDELHQALVPGRTGRVEDLLIDASGAAIGAAAASILSRARSRRGPGERAGVPGDDP